MKKSEAYNASPDLYHILSPAISLLRKVPLVQAARNGAD